MQKSMVHELNTLATSNVQFTRQSFIHTTHQNGEYNELRKSRIQNLPNYRKDDLSQKLNFVTVFQGIQIQRLSCEIETARVRIKDYERQIGNYENYEVQIRQLTEKCHAYEMQKQDHQESMEKMHKVCQELYDEINMMTKRYADVDLSLKEKYRLEQERCHSVSQQLQKWKARYAASESSKAKQLEDMRYQLQNQRKSMLQRQIRELSVKHESERSMLESELRKMRESMNNKNSQIDRMRMQLSQSQVRQNELSQYEGRLDEYEDKLMMMAQENMRLNELLRNKKEEIEFLKNQERQFTLRIQNFSKIQNQFKQVNSRIHEYEDEIRQWNQRFSRLEAENSKNIKASQKAEDYGRLLDESAEEMERMNSIIREKISEIEKWKSQNQRLSIELDESKATQSRIAEYENHIAIISSENSRLNEVLKTRLTEIESWKSKYAQIQTKLPLLTETENQCKNLRDKLSTEVNNKLKYTEKIRTMETDLVKAAEMQKYLINERAANLNLHKEVQRLNISIRNLSGSNSDLTRKLTVLQSEIKQNGYIKQSLQECKKKIAYMTQELDRINSLLHKKIQEIHQLKQNYNSVNINISRYRTIEEQLVQNLQQTEHLVLKLDESRRENDCMQEKVFTQESAVKKMQSDMFMLSEEKDKLTSALNSKKSQIEALNAQSSKMSEEISKLRQIEQQYQALTKSHTQMESRYTELESRYNKESLRSREYSNQVESLSSEIMKLKTETNFSKQFISEFKNIRCQVEVKDQQIATLLKRIAKIEQILQKAKQQSKKNYNNMCVYQQRWTGLNKSFQIMNMFIQKYVELQGRVENLSEQNLELESSVRIMNVEMAESGYASQSSWNNAVAQQKDSDFTSTGIIMTSEQPSTSYTSYSYQSSSNTGNHSDRAQSSHEPSYEANSGNNIQLSTINEESQRVYTQEYEEPPKTNPFNKKEDNSSNSSSYYESQVRQIHGGNGFGQQGHTNMFSPKYTSSHQSSHQNISKFSTGSPTNNSSRVSSNYTTSMRPVSYQNPQQQYLQPQTSSKNASSYIYGSSLAGGSPYGASQIQSRLSGQVGSSSPSSHYSGSSLVSGGGSQQFGANKYMSGVSSGDNNNQVSSKISTNKQYHYSSRVEDGSSGNGQNEKKTDKDSRRMVLSPVRFFN